MRKFVIILGVFLGVCLLAFVGMGVFLMLSPGSKLFGVQYVKADSTSSANITKTYDEDLMGDIIIETYGFILILLHFLLLFIILFSIPFVQIQYNKNCIDIITKYAIVAPLILK